MSKRWPTAIDLFCGCGGVTEGLRSCRFRVVAAVDNSDIACKTYKRNHKHVRLFNRDISEIDPASIREKLLCGEPLGLLVVCAPCQPFSSQNRKTGKDERSQLLLEAVRFAKHLEPQLILFENVPGLRRQRFSKLLKELRTKLSLLGYTLGDPEVINAADYGVPQRRIRCIMLASKGQEPPSLPEPLTPEGKRRTVRHAIGSLKRLSTGESSSRDCLHFAREHHPITLERLNHTPKDGGTRSSLPEHLVLKCHKDHRGHPDVYGRMHWNDVAPTLTTGCNDLTKGRFAHPEDNRSITLREAARLQTFKDSYIFCGSTKEIAAQIGNAVPVRLVEAIAPTLYRLLVKDPR